MTRRLTVLGIAIALHSSVVAQPLLYVNGLIESTSTAAAEANSGVGSIEYGPSDAIGSRVTQSLVSTLSDLGFGYYGWSTASAIAFGSGFWPDEPSYWYGGGSYLARTDGVRGLLFTGQVPRIDLAYLEQMALGQGAGFAFAAYRDGHGSARAGGSHYTEFEILIPFRVSRDVPAVLFVGQSTHYSVATSGHPMIFIEEVPPFTDARIYRWNPAESLWELIAGLFYRASLDGYRGPGRYLDIGHRRITIQLRAGEQYRLVIRSAGMAEFVGQAGNTTRIDASFGGGIGSSILLLVNRSTVPDTIKIADIRCDLNADGVIDDADLVAVLYAMGDEGTNLPPDINSDGVVDDADLLEVLVRFGMSY